MLINVIHCYADLHRDILIKVMILVFKGIDGNLITDINRYNFLY